MSSHLSGMLARRRVGRLAAGAAISLTVAMAATVPAAVSASASTRLTASGGEVHASATVSHKTARNMIIRPATDVWAGGNLNVIDVQTGAKNYSNHTQWVTGIAILSNTAANDNLGCGLFEAWTQGFYASSYGCGAVYYYIERWVSTGNNVCGAFTAYNTNWPRSIACISIRV